MRANLTCQWVLMTPQKPQLIALLENLQSMQRARDATQLNYSRKWPMTMIQLFEALAGQSHLLGKEISGQKRPLNILNNILLLLRKMHLHSRKALKISILKQSIQYKKFPQRSTNSTILKIFWQDKN